MRKASPIVAACLSSAAVFAVTPVMPRHPALSPDASRIAFFWQGDI